MKVGGGAARDGARDGTGVALEVARWSGSPLAAAAVVPGGGNVDQLGGGGAAVVADRDGGDLAELAALDVGHVAQEHTAVSGSRWSPSCTRSRPAPSSRWSPIVA